MAKKGIDLMLYANTGDSEAPEWTVVGGQRNATFHEERDTIEVSDKSTDSKSYEYNKYSWTISADGLYVPDDTAYGELTSAIRNGNKLLVRIKDEAESSYILEGEVLVTTHDLEGPFEDAATYSVELQGSGELTENPA